MMLFLDAQTPRVIWSDSLLYHPQNVQILQFLFVSNNITVFSTSLHLLHNDWLFHNYYFFAHIFP